MSNFSVKKFSGDTLLDHLLICRNIEDKEKFLNPSYENGLNDPFLINDMKKAVDRIDRAISNNERIIIFSDYDADGIPGSVALSDFFKMIAYENVGVYIPHRHKEGFGLNEEAVRSIGKDGANLIITIDCGITDVSEVALLNTLQVDVIITDHHEPGLVLPNAFAIINPKISPDYKDKMLCGSGVVFKLIQAMLSVNRRGVSEGKEKWLLDMVGLATLSDMVPLVGENRILASFGIKVLRKSPRVGLKKLLSSLKISQKDLNEDDIAFMITPRINVASRMGDPIDAFRLLSTTDEYEAEELVNKLNDLNSERKGIVGAIIREIENKIKSRDLEDKKVIVLGNPSWRPAVLGLVANSLIKEHQKPVFLWGRGDGEILKGSCRSEGVTDVVSLMNGIEDGIFIDRGGHKMSGGFSIMPDKVHLLEELLCLSYQKNNIEGDKSSTLIIDHELSIDEVDNELWNVIDKFSPFGTENPKPIFLFRSVKPILVKMFGKQKEHLEIVFEKNNGRKVSAISFFAKDNEKLKNISERDRIDLVATCEKSVFKSYPEIRLRIVDVLQ